MNAHKNINYTDTAMNTNVNREWIISSPRLRLRRLVYEDFHWLKPILQNETVMYAWEHAFTDREVQEWIEANLLRYAKEGFSYFAAFCASEGTGACTSDFQHPQPENISTEIPAGQLSAEFNFSQPIGVMGPLIETIEGRPFTGIAYILDKPFWHQDYATEGARACIRYAFQTLHAERVIAEIRPDNLASRQVAERLGMQVEGEFIKHYQGKAMPHLIYALYPHSELEY